VVTTLVRANVSPTQKNSSPYCNATATRMLQMLASVHIDVPLIIFIRIQLLELFFLQFKMRKLFEANISVNRKPI